MKLLNIIDRINFGEIVARSIMPGDIIECINGYGSWLQDGERYRIFNAYKDENTDTGSYFADLDHPSGRGHYLSRFKTI